jgi:hypothetical protein
MSSQVGSAPVNKWRQTAFVVAGQTLDTFFFVDTGHFLLSPIQWHPPDRPGSTYRSGCRHPDPLRISAAPRSAWPDSGFRRCGPQLIPEVAQGREHRVGAGLAQPAEGGILDGLRQAFQFVEILGSPWPFADFLQSSSWRRVPSRQGVHLPQDSSWMKSMKNGPCPPCRCFVHDDGAAGPHDGADLGNLLVVHRRVQVLLRDTPAGGPAQLNRLEFALVGDAAADVVDHGAQGGAHGHFHQADVVDIPGQGEDLGSLAGFGTDTGIPGTALEDDLGTLAKVSTLLRMVGFSHKPLWRRKRRARVAACRACPRWIASARFPRRRQRRRRPGRFPHQNQSRNPGCCRPDQPVFPGLFDGHPQPADGQGIFGAGVNVARDGRRWPWRR